MAVRPAHAGALLQRAGFALPVADVDRVTVRYHSVFALMQDLRRMGAANALVERRRAPTRGADIQVGIELTFEEAARGASKPNSSRLRASSSACVAVPKPFTAATSGGAKPGQLRGSGSG